MKLFQTIPVLLVFTLFGCGGFGDHHEHNLTEIKKIENDKHLIVKKITGSHEAVRFHLNDGRTLEVIGQPLIIHYDDTLISGGEGEVAEVRDGLKKIVFADMTETDTSYEKHGIRGVGYSENKLIVMLESVKFLTFTGKIKININ